MTEIIDKTTETKKEKTPFVRPYTLRPLKDDDVWPILDIVGKVLPEDMQEMLANALLQKKSVEEMGALFIVRFGCAIIKDIHKVHDEVYALMECLSGIPADEIQQMGLGTLPLMVKDTLGMVKNAPFFEELLKSS